MLNKKIGFVINQTLFKKVKLRCLELDITMTNYLINLIKKDLQQKGE